MKEISRHIARSRQGQGRKGQAILFVVVAMTIALSVGVAISNRTLSSLSRSSRSDTANRVFAAAEGGVERVLTLTYEDLNKMSEDSGYCPEEFYFIEDSCGLDFPPTNPEDPIVSRSLLTVSSFSYNNEATRAYDFTVNPDFVKEVTLEGYGDDSIKFCWSYNEDSPTVIYYYTYGEDQVYDKGLVTPSGGGFDTNRLYNHEGSNSGAEDGFNACHEVSLDGDAYGIRFRSLYGTSEMGVYGDLGQQGYKITSKGQLLEEGKEKSVRTIDAYKSLPYLPSIFDTAVYTEQSID
jgi:hypothetical protein